MEPEHQQVEQLDRQSINTSDHEQNTSISSSKGTSIPKNMQSSIEYMTNVSLKDVKVYYDSERATEQGVATFHEGTDVYVAPGAEEQLGAELWKVAEELKQLQGSSEPLDNKKDTVVDDEDGGKLDNSEIGEEVHFDVDGESHKIWFENQGNTTELMMASTPKPIEEKIETWREQIAALDETDENLSKKQSMYNLVVKCHQETQQDAIQAAKLAAKQEAEDLKNRTLERNESSVKRGKITEEDNERRKVVLEREYRENLLTRAEEVDYHVAQSQIALKEAIKRLLLLLGDKDKVKVGEEEVELAGADEERISNYYDIAIIGVGSATARWLYTNTKTYDKGIVIGRTGGWQDRGQTTTSHPKSIVKPTTPTPEEQSETGLTDKGTGNTIFERADDHVGDIERLVEQSGFERSEESTKAIRKEGEWSLISCGNNGHTIAAKKIVLATGAGPENQLSREVANETDNNQGYRKVVGLNEFMRGVEGLQPQELEQRRAEFGQREVLIFGGNAVVDAIHVCKQLGFNVHPRSRSGFVGHLPGTKNTLSEAEYEEKFKGGDGGEQLIAGYYEGHEISNGKVKVSFTGGEEIEVDQFVAAIGPDSRQIATETNEAGPIAILGGPSRIDKLLQPIYDLGEVYSDEKFATVLGLESEDGLLEVIGAAAFRAGAFVKDTAEARRRKDDLDLTRRELLSQSNTVETLQKLERVKQALQSFKSVMGKFDNTKQALAKSVIVAEQLGSLNSTIEAINRVNAVLKDDTGETATKVTRQIQQDGVNMQIDAWQSIQRYIVMHWNYYTDNTETEETEKMRLAEIAAKAVVKARKLSEHPHGITWEAAETIIKKKLN